MASGDKRVLLDITDGIATVSLNRPDKYNGLDMPMFSELIATARKLRKNRSVRAVILTGEGKAFCSGLDVKTVSKNPLNFVRLLIKPFCASSNMAQNLAYEWRKVPAPVIAVCHGYCFGGGFQLALGADFRFTTPDCDFSIMESKWGLIPDMSLAITLRELVTIDLAKELTMTARRFNGEQALEYGLVSRVSDHPLEEAKALAKELAARSPDAVAAAKLLFNRTWTASDRTALKWETRLQMKILGRANQRLAMSRNTKKSEKDYGNRRSF